MKSLNFLCSTLSMGVRKLLERISDKFYQKDLRELDENRIGIIEERNSMGKKLIGIVGGIVIGGLIGGFVYNMWKNRDSDGDGIPDEIEKKYGTDPFKKDTDGDGISDYEEIFKYGANPLNADMDNDGIPDGDEVFKYETDPLKPNPNIKYALDKGLEKYLFLVKPLDNDGVQDTNEKQFVELIANNKKILEISTFSNYLREKAADGKITDEELKYSTNFSYLVKGLYDKVYETASLYEDMLKSRIEHDEIFRIALKSRIKHEEALKAIPFYQRILSQISDDGEITNYEEFFKPNSLYQKILDLQILDPLKTIDYSSNLGLRLGFDRELAKDATIKAIAYYGVAVVDRKLPENFDEIYLLTKATQIDKYGDKLVDFSPIFTNVFHINGYYFDLVPDAGRETWMLAKHLKLIKDSGFDILKHPEMFEGLNGKIIANAYSIFDAEYGINYAEQFINGRTLKPVDNDVWDLIMLQWNLYSNKAPQLGGGDKLYNRDFPWYDSDKLDLLYKDPNNRRQALFFLFFLDSATVDKREGVPFNTEIAGLEGAKLALIQAEEDYNIVSSLYPNGKIKHEIWGDVPVWWFYYDWIEDRGVRELENAHLQYVDLKPLELWEIMTEDPDNVWNRIKDLNGVDQFVTKNWDYWHLMKVVMGYERGFSPNWYEDSTINYTIPQALRAFGFPTYFVNIYPVSRGASGYEWVVSLPDYVAEKIKSKFGDEIIIGPANGFGLYLCKDGLLKDGIEEILGFSEGYLLYKRNGKIDVNDGLSSNFIFYFVKN